MQRGLIRGASQRRVLTLCLGVQGAALVWVLAFGYAFSWVFATIGLVTRNPEAEQFAAALPLFVLVFASSAFVPVPALPGWLQAFANARPHVDQARIVARGLAAAGKPLSRRALRSNGIKGSNEALNALAHGQQRDGEGGAMCSGWLTRPTSSVSVVWLTRLAEHFYA